MLYKCMSLERTLFAGNAVKTHLYPFTDVFAVILSFPSVFYSEGFSCRLFHNKVTKILKMKNAIRLFCFFSPSPLHVLAPSLLVSFICKNKVANNNTEAVTLNCFPPLSLELRCNFARTLCDETCKLSALILLQKTWVRKNTLLLKLLTGSDLLLVSHKGRPLHVNLEFCFVLFMWFISLAKNFLFALCTLSHTLHAVKPAKHKEWDQGSPTNFICPSGFSFQTRDISLQNRNTLGLMWAVMALFLLSFSWMCLFCLRGGRGRNWGPRARLASEKKGTSISRRQLT